MAAAAVHLDASAKLTLAAQHSVGLYLSLISGMAVCEFRREPAHMVDLVTANGFADEHHHRTFAKRGG